MYFLKYDFKYHKKLKIKFWNFIFVTSHLIVFHTIKQNIISWSSIADSRNNSHTHIVC